MQRLITTGDVANFLGVPNAPTIEPHIDHAQRQVAGYIRARSLDERADIEQTFTLDEWTEIVTVRDGPIAEVTAFEIDGESIDIDDLDINAWTVAFPDMSGSSATITYTRGYTSATVPEDLKGAIISIAAKVNQSPNVDIVYKKIGDLIEQHASGVPGAGPSNAFPPEVVMVLNRYRKPKSQIA